MYYILIYKTVDNYVERRSQFREDHLKLANEYYQNGSLIMAGALANPVDEAILVFKGNDRTIVESFVKRDPYVINGLIVKWQVREWTVVIGN